MSAPHYKTIRPGHTPVTTPSGWDVLRNETYDATIETVLESLCDTFTAEKVVSTLAEIFKGKASHMEVNWQPLDAYDAKRVRAYLKMAEHAEKQQEVAEYWGL